MSASIASTEMDESKCYWTGCGRASWFRGGPCEPHGRWEDEALIAAEESFEEQQGEEAYS